MKFFFFSSRRRHTRFDCDWSSDVCSSDLGNRLARAVGATVTVMHVDVPGGSLVERQREQHLFQTLVAGAADAPRMRTASVASDSVEEAVLAETADRKSTRLNSSHSQISYA